MTAASLDRLREQPLVLAAVGIVAVLALLGVLVALGVVPAGPLGDDGNDRYEPNDDFVSTATIERGTHEDLVLAADDYDVYAASLAEGQTVTATIRFEHDDGDLDLEAYGPGRQILARSDSTGDDEALTVTAEERGRHYLLVYGHEGASNEYALEVESESQL